MALAMAVKDSAAVGTVLHDEIHWPEFGLGYIEAARAGFSAIEASGYVVVPVTPTEHMIDIGACHEDQDHDIFDEGHIATDVYRAMTEAGKV